MKGERYVLENKYLSENYSRRPCVRDRADHDSRCRSNYWLCLDTDGSNHSASWITGAGLALESLRLSMLGIESFRKLMMIAILPNATLIMSFRVGF